VKEPIQRVVAWVAALPLDRRARSVEEVRALRPRAVVAVRTDRIGDLLVSTPLLAALHRLWPEARLFVVPGPRNRVVLDGLPFVETGPVFRRDPASWLRLAAWLRREKFDVAVSLRVEAMSGVFVAAASGAPVRMIAETARTAAAFNFIAGADEPHHLARNCRAAELLGVPCPAPRPVFHVPDTVRERAAALVGESWSGGSGPLIGVQVPSRVDRRHVKRAWPGERVVELVRGLLASGRRVVLFGVGPERQEAVRIRSVEPEAKLAPAGSLALAAALLERLDLFVSGFTGTHHLADAVSTPTVAIGSTRQALFWRSLGPGHRLAVAPRTSQVTVAQVMGAVEEALIARRR
jgi:heptosyltransferase-2/heptosyltransferase-3